VTDPHHRKRTGRGWEPKTTMLFGDAKDSIVNLIGAVKAV
jgi:hypothetical protein